MTIDDSKSADDEVKPEAKRAKQDEKYGHQAARFRAGWRVQAGENR